MQVRKIVVPCNLEGCWLLRCGWVLWYVNMHKCVYMWQTNRPIKWIESESYPSRTCLWPDSSWPGWWWSRQDRGFGGSRSHGARSTETQIPWAAYIAWFALYCFRGSLWFVLRLLVLLSVRDGHLVSENTLRGCMTCQPKIDRAQYLSGRAWIVVVMNVLHSVSVTQKFGDRFRLWALVTKSMCIIGLWPLL